MIFKKVCLIGTFAVGKTSLVSRFVTGKFSGKYQTTIGVKIDRKELEVAGVTARLMIWDLAGENELHKVPATYLEGAHGFLYVADGTRRETLDRALGLLEEHREKFGERPALLLLNKNDLTAEWDLSEAQVEQAASLLPTYRTSAKTGAHVEGAFLELASMMIGKSREP